MTNITPIDGLRNAREEAAEWVVRIDNDSLKPEQNDALRQWLQQSPANQQAFAELAQVWGLMDSLGELSELIPLDPTMSEQPSTTPSSYGWRSVAMFSLVLFFAVSLAVFYPEWQAQQFRYTQVVTTHIGEQQTLALPDGSTLVLNTDSNVNIQYDQDRRNIYLNRGEAHFEVAHDPARPFVVHAGKGRVTAIGTAFNVQYHNGAVDVIVTDGVVKVDTVVDVPALTLNNSNKPVDVIAPVVSTSVKAGQQVSFDTVVHEVNKIPAPEVNRKLSWRQGMLSFAGEPLSRAIAEVSRYTETKIIIEDPLVAELPVGGYFKAGETEAMLEVLEVSFGLKITRVSDKVIVLSRGENFNPE